jgi:hypothetical protein
MKVEFLEEGSPDCPLLRLFDYRTDEVKRLCEVCDQLAEGKRVEFVLHDQPWVEAIRGCRFLWRISKKDVGVRLPAPGEPFVLEFSDEVWREVQDKLRPFADGSGGFQWLTNEGDVNVLISFSGLW